MSEPARVAAAPNAADSQTARNCWRASSARWISKTKQSQGQGNEGSNYESQGDEADASARANCFSHDVDLHCQTLSRLAVFVCPHRQPEIFRQPRDICRKIFLLNVSKRLTRPVTTTSI